jgi:hypothetical protein
MATIYADRAIITASNGTFSFEPGDVTSISFDISDAARDQQGFTTDHSTSGFTAPNRRCSVSFGRMLRKGEAFSDFLKNVDYSQSVTIAGLVATSGSGLELNPVSRITAINVIAASNDFKFPSQGTAASSSVTFLAQDYEVA